MSFFMSYGLTFYGKRILFSLFVRLGWTTYMYLFASQPFNGLKLSESADKSEMCWPFILVCSRWFSWGLNFSSFVWHVQESSSLSRNWGKWLNFCFPFYIFLFPFISFSSSLFEDYINIHAFYTECFSSCPEGRIFQMGKEF